MVTQRAVPKKDEAPSLLVVCDQREFGWRLFDVAGGKKGLFATRVNTLEWGSETLRRLMEPAILGKNDIVVFHITDSAQIEVVKEAIKAAGRWKHLTVVVGDTDEFGKRSEVSVMTPDSTAEEIVDEIRRMIAPPPPKEESQEGEAEA